MTSDELRVAAQEARHSLHALRVGGRVDITATIERLDAALASSQPIMASGDEINAVPIIWYDSPDRARRFETLSALIERHPGRTTFAIQNAALLAADLRAAAPAILSSEGERA